VIKSAGFKQKTLGGARAPETSSGSSLLNHEITKNAPSALLPGVLLIFVSYQIVLKGEIGNAKT
jgi:hypothetical protein